MAAGEIYFKSTESGRIYWRDHNNVERFNNGIGVTSGITTLSTGEVARTGTNSSLYTRPPGNSSPVVARRHNADRNIGSTTLADGFLWVSSGTGKLRWAYNGFIYELDWD